MKDCNLYSVKENLVDKFVMPTPYKPIVQGNCSICGWPGTWHGGPIDVCPRPNDRGVPEVTTYLNPDYFSQEEEIRFASRDPRSQPRLAHR